ncbi:hypothetical protein BGW38_009510 [Lunasporangiospora selenospora]|uniref:Uncharacterized protein n=1 Tax=Lunasporangiospora selenospora TaxID=979761 RepID=A0A9P6FJ06_9FUNG|nr:hypothetical protein BGW38_009510 [Lunasporangiospora selenospora]
MSASDKGQVEVHVNSQSQYGTEYVEVIGKVRDDLSIEEFTCANFGNSFDMDVYNELVTKMQQFPSVF